MQLPKTSNIKELKPKFVELAKRYHPDTGEVKDASRFKSVL